MRPKAIPLAFFPVIGSFAVRLHFLADSRLMSHLITFRCSEWDPSSTQTIIQLKYIHYKR
jgi:hypothetical protein